MLFKKCPRCQGDLYLEEDAGSRDLVCLQCGSRQSLSSQFVFTFAKAGDAGLTTEGRLQHIRR